MKDIFRRFLFLFLSAIGVINPLLVIIAKQPSQPCRKRTTRERLIIPIVEQNMRFCRITPFCICVFLIFRIQCFQQDLSDVFKVKMVSCQKESRQHARLFFIGQRTQRLVILRLNFDIIQRLPHPKLFKQRMGNRRTFFLWLERTTRNQALLRFKRTLKKDRAMQRLLQLIGHPLLFANELKLC